MINLPIVVNEDQMDFSTYRNSGSLAKHPEFQEVNFFGSKEIDLKTESVLGFAICDELTLADFNWFNHLMSERLQQNRSLQLYLEINHFEGISPMTLWKDFRVGVKTSRFIERVAVLSEKNWMENAAHVDDQLILGTDMKYFCLSEQRKALHWLKKPC